MPGGTNDYIGSTTTGITSGGYVSLGDGGAYMSWGEDGQVSVVSQKEAREKGIHPSLYFKYIKKKFKPLENRRITLRLKELERAFDAAVENGQNALGEKFLAELAVTVRESMMLAKGISRYVEYGDLARHKRKIRGGHISDTKFEDYTRVVPRRVLKRKKEVECCFDGFVVYHYWNEKAQKDAKGMSDEERSKMRDPVLFGVIRENDRLYFVADWEDEFCDLTFDEMVSVIGSAKRGGYEGGEITKNPELCKDSPRRTTTPRRTGASPTRRSATSSSRKRASGGSTSRARRKRN